jgi:hypothetical protein
MREYSFGATPIDVAPFVKSNRKVRPSSFVAPAGPLVLRFHCSSGVKRAAAYSDESFSPGLPGTRRTSSKSSAPCVCPVLSMLMAIILGGPCGTPSLAPPQWPVQPPMRIVTSAQTPSGASKFFWRVWPVASV